MPVFVGPVAGWKGPVLAARPTRPGTPGLPAEAKAYAGDNPNGVEDAAANGEPNAQTELKRAVRTPRLDHRTKLVRHAALEAKPEGKSLSPKVNSKAEVKAKAKAGAKPGAAPVKAKPSGVEEKPSPGQ